MELQGPRRCWPSRAKHQIRVAKDKEGEAPFSVDANLLHSSSEGKVLEDPARKRRKPSISAPFADGGAGQGHRGADRSTRATPSASTARRRCRRPRLTELNALGKANRHRPSMTRSRTASSA
jgi:hypothetical protein